MPPTDVETGPAAGAAQHKNSDGLLHTASCKGANTHSFQLLPAYRDSIHLQAPGATMDLSIDPATGRCIVLLLPTAYPC